MARALELAERAGQIDEVPVGALVVIDGLIIGEGHNQPIGKHDPTAHAEISALRAACEQVGNYRLPNATLYVTVEPCTMCTGALIHARIERLVFATREPKSGAVVSHPIATQESVNHHFEITEGVLAPQSRALLRRFFAARRCDAKSRRGRKSQVKDHEGAKAASAPVDSNQKGSG